jgi:galactose mutarotase-like enzyme
VLFPLVGKVKNNQLLIDGSAYPMPQHGFARDAVFTSIKQTDTSVLFELKANDTSLQSYPYKFTLQLGYELVGHTLKCTYDVWNTDSKPMHFSIGAHPGFNLPTAKLTDYMLLFSQPEQPERFLLNNGLFNGNSKAVFTEAGSIDLTPTLFDDDAIVFKNITSKQVELKQRSGSFSIGLTFEGFPDIGIWTQKDCELYICLEPWCGHADPIDGHDDISTKPGINTLQPGEQFSRSYTLSFNCP